MKIKMKQVKDLTQCNVCDTYYESLCDNCIKQSAKKQAEELYNEELKPLDSKLQEFLDKLK